MMMEKASEKIFTELKDDISAYVGLRFRLLKLNAIERIARVIAVLSHGIILLLLVFFTLLFLFTALGFFLGEVVGSTALGFLMVGGLYLLLTLGVLWRKDRLRVKMMNVVIEAIMSNEDEDNE